MSNLACVLKTDCDCCAASTPSLLARISNLPGLVADCLPCIGCAMTCRIHARPLSSADCLLVALTTREASDLRSPSLDATSTLSFYTERFANEHYLRTATERQSVREMAADRLA